MHVAELSSGCFLLYFMAYFVSVIVMLNLLIAVIGEKFGVILEQTVPMDCVERSILMLEIEGFAGFLERIGYFKPDTNDQFIHFVRYRSD